MKNTFLIQMMAMIHCKRGYTGVTPLGFYCFFFHVSTEISPLWGSLVGVSVFLQRCHPSGVEVGNGNSLVPVGIIEMSPLWGSLVGVSAFLQRCHPSGVLLFFFPRFYRDITPLGFACGGIGLSTEMPPLWG